MATLFYPASPTLSDMLNAHISYIHSEPFQRSPMVETGVIIGMQEHKGTLQIRVKPDNPRLLTKWRDADTHLIGYVRN